MRRLDFRNLLPQSISSQRLRNQYKGSMFKLPQLFRWHVIVTSPKFVDELRKAGDDELNFMDAANEVRRKVSRTCSYLTIQNIQGIQTDFTIGEAISTNPYHVPIIRSQLTRNLSVLFRDIRDELTTAFNDIIPPINGKCMTCCRSLESIVKMGFCCRVDQCRCIAYNHEDRGSD